MLNPIGEKTSLKRAQKIRVGVTFQPDFVVVKLGDISTALSVDEANTLAQQITEALRELRDEGTI